MHNSKHLKIKNISMKLQIDNGDPFYDSISFYEGDKGYKKWSKSNLQTLANKRWMYSPNFTKIKRKVKILESKVKIYEIGDPMIEE